MTHNRSTALAGRIIRNADGREGIAVSSEWTPGVDAPTVTVDVDGAREVWWLNAVAVQRSGVEG